MGQTKLIFLVILLLVASTRTEAQREREPFDEEEGRKGRFFLVPEFWLSFGNSTYIEVTPLLGYHVNDRLSLGLGPHYIYQSWKATPSLPADQTHVYGLKVFARFAIITNAEEFLPINLFSELFAHVEYEGMSLENGVYGTQGSDDRYLVHAFLVGGGLSQRIGMYNSVSFMVLWDLNESGISAYTNPVFRVGFNTYF